MNPSLLLIIVVGERALSEGKVHRLASSIEPLARNGEVSIAVGNRTRTAMHCVFSPTIWGQYLEVDLPSDTSLSASRNAVIGRYVLTGAQIDDLVLNFPDDDSHFFDAVETVNSVLRLIPNGFDLVLGGYGPSPEARDRTRFPDREIQISQRTLANVANSVGLFIRGSSFLDLGQFDERMGVGTQLGSSEDLSLILFAWAKSLRIRYEPTVFLGHAYKDATFSSYWLGNIAALRVNATRKEVSTTGVRWQLAFGTLRRVVAGVRLYLRGSIPLRTLLAGVKLAARGPSN